MVMKMNKEYFNQRIDCTVNNCQFYDENHKKCTLGKITVSNKNAICTNYEKNELK